MGTVFDSPPSRFWRLLDGVNARFGSDKRPSFHDCGQGFCVAFALPLHDQRNSGEHFGQSRLTHASRDPHRLVPGGGTRLSTTRQRARHVQAAAVWRHPRPWRASRDRATAGLADWLEAFIPETERDRMVASLELDL